MWVKFYNQFGIPVGMAKPESVARSWRLNDVGKAVVTIPRSLVDENLIGFGRYMTIQSDEAEMWGGVMMPARRWKRDLVSVTGFSGERLLQGRKLPRTLELKRSPGGVFRKVITWVHDNYQPNLTLGQISREGDKVEREYHFHDAWDVVQELADESDSDFWIQPYLTWKKRLRFRAHWYVRRGKDMSKKILLSEPVNVADPLTLDESSEIYNHWICVGKGDDWSTVPVAEWYGPGYSDISGKWTAVEIFANVTDVGSLERRAKRKVRKTKRVDSLFGLTLLNRDGLWNKISVGDTVRLVTRTMGFLHSGVGFRGNVRVVAKSLDEADGFMPVVLEQVKKREQGDQV